MLKTIRDVPGKKVEPIPLLLHYKFGVNNLKPVSLIPYTIPSDRHHAIIYSMRHLY